MLIAEYKDVWKIERKITDKNEVKASIYKERTMIEINNQVIETFLQEVVIMRQFNHPNVLSLIGVSIHNNKPCALLPLMTNKDVNSFLKRNQEASTVFKII